MFRKLIVLALILAGVGFSAGVLEIKPLENKEVILVLAPHPDDETIGCGGVIQKAREIGCPVYIVFFTNGDHNQVAFKLYEKKIVLQPRDYIKMGELRRQEALAATRILGVPKENLIFLGYPDYGTLKIWKQHWQDAAPYRNFLTRATRVPYPENYSYQAEYKGESILNDLKSIFLKLQPNRIFVSSPADTNFDHRALYNFTRVALLDLEGKIPPPLVYPYLVHCGRWPYPYHYHPDLVLKPPAKLTDSEITWEGYNLTEEQIQKKLAAIDCYKSQKVASGSWLVSFVKKNEIFGDYQVINLARSQLVGDKVFLTGVGEGDFSPEVLAEKSKIDRFSFHQEDKELLLQVKFSRILEKELGFTVYLFGYSRRIPFPRMPKISISLMPAERIIVRDGGDILVSTGVVVKRERQAVYLKVPLSLLANPDFVFLAVESYAGEIPVDLTAQRLVALK